jgi:XTP/dITP diphosphohydrolase
MRLVIATHNAKKAGEMRQILQERFPALEIRDLSDYPDAPEPEETGTTYAENATIKALGAVEATGEWCVADDAGLEIDALDGAPGLHSKRFEGADTDFPTKMARILELLREVPEDGRGARFRCCVALARPGELCETLEATCEGRIADAPAGQGGFGYDPIFFAAEAGRRLAELTPEEKHAVSHRGKVLRALAQRLEALLPPTSP